MAIRKLLCANRGEIAIRVFRACTELGIRTVAVYSDEDRIHEHRHKADEAYLVGKGKRPVEAYLGIEEILDIAQRAGADAIHPGYGFLSENADFARACVKRGITFVGPSPDVVALMGDKVAAKALAQRVGIPCVPGTTLTGSLDEVVGQASAFFDQHGGPVLVKAANGGGGRGMRVVRQKAELRDALTSARSESLAAFGSDAVFLERFLEKVRHIEVQVLGDLHGNLVHLFERDCSVQRRHQKVIEIAPAPSLAPTLRDAICSAALSLCRAANYTNAGTVEFLVEGDRFFFIEVNARLQVEHTVSEQVTGVDLVQAQIRVAEGEPLSSPKIGISSQAAISTRGYAIQLRVTTEDPGNNFLPDAGTITAWRPATGFGIRLDGGNGYTGAYISSAYDSMLVKIIASASSFEEATRKAARALKEFRIRGVKTNLQFLENVITHPVFVAGATWTRFIDETKELFALHPKRDRASKLMAYLGEVIVNGHATIKKDQRLAPSKLLTPRVPIVPAGTPPNGTKQILDAKGAEGLAQWVLQQSRPLLTDTTMRDAHQSLLATRMRTYDITRIAHATAHLAPDLFSLECWGGATFDTSYRFLHEDPWDRLRRVRKLVPNLLLQMLLRGANAVGYTSYPNNVVEAFIDEAAEAGIDVFRIFDSLNDLDSMRVSIDRVRKTGKVAEVAISYTGDVANPKRPKYTLDYYADLAKRIEDAGAHFLCIKDMAGLLRPRAAGLLVAKLRETVKLPIHLHTHDTSGNGVAMLLEAIDHGVHVVDAALAPMAGLTSQPSLNALVSALRGYPKDTLLTNKKLQPLANYWEDVRDMYAPFECGLKSSTSEVYFHEIPGGQYSNLRPQVAEMGLIDRWQEVKEAFALVNALCGDIPKVTPSSKMVGDFAIFLVKNNLMVRKPTLEESTRETEAVLIDRAPRLDFPESVVGYFQGQLGQPPGGFPPKLRQAILKGLTPITGLPGAALPPLDFAAKTAVLAKKWGRTPSRAEVVSHALYPRVVDDFMDARAKYEDVSILDTPTYFYGLDVGNERWVELEPGKTLIVSLEAVGHADAQGDRSVFFLLNGHRRQVTVKDRALAPAEASRRLADAGNPSHVGASMPGVVIAVHQAMGAKVTEGAPLFTLEAMKMETIVRAHKAGVVAEVVVAQKAKVQAGDLLAVIG